MGFWRYVFSVGGLALAGTVVIGAVTYTIEGGSFAVGLSGALFVLVWAAAAMIPLGALWVGVFAGVFAGIAALARRPAWWMGAVAGLLAGGAVAAVLFVYADDPSFSVQGPPYERAEAVLRKRQALIAPVLWSTVSGALLIRFAPVRIGSVRRGILR